jgi:hypothetical protein
MGFDAYVWIDLEFPSDPKDCMNRWKQAPLDGAQWSDWGGFGFVAGPIAGFGTVAAVLAQAGRYAARERLEGRLCVFSVALGPTQVKVRAFLDKAQSDWWRTFAVMARAAAPLDAVGEFGWASAANGERECHVATIGDGQSQFRQLTPDEVRRLDRHPAVAELDAKRAALPATAPAPVKLQAPTPRPPGSGRGYRRHSFPRPAAKRSDPVPLEEEAPDEEAVAVVAALEDDVSSVADTDTDAEAGEGAETGEGADEEGAADGADAETMAPRSPAASAASRPPTARAAPRLAAGRSPAKAVGDPAGKAAAKGAPVKAVPVKGAPVKAVPVKGAPAKPAPAKPAPAKSVPAKPAPAKPVPAKPAPAKPAPAKKKPPRGK